MPPDRVYPAVNRIVAIVVVAATGLLFGCLLWNHYQLVVYPALLDYYEGAMPSITQTVAAGESPYSLASQPARISVYPPLYNLIAVPLSQFFGYTLPVHRAVSAFFILASVGLCYLVALRATRSVILAAQVGGIFYAGLLFYSTPIASPNSVGLFFFLLSVTAPWFGRFNNSSLVIASLCGLLAFFSKQYFLASLGYISLYLLLFVSVRKAVLFGLSSSIALVLAVLLVQWSSPYFIDDIIFAVQRATSLIASNEVVLNQLLLYSKIYAGLFFTLVVVGVLFVMGGGWVVEGVHTATKGLSGTNGRRFDAPLLPREWDYIWFCFACSLAVVCLVIGKNPGNHMTYLFQLMSPFFLVGTYTLVARLDPPGRLLVTPMLLYTLFASYRMLPKDFSSDMNGWDRLEAAISTRQEVYASPLALPYLLAGQREIYNNGHSAYFFYSRHQPAWLADWRGHVPNTLLWEKHVERIHQGIVSKKFGLIVLDTWTRIPDLGSNVPEARTGQKLLRRYYRVTDTIPVALANRPGGGEYTLKVWTPRD